MKKSKLSPGQYMLIFIIIIIALFILGFFLGRVFKPKTGLEEYNHFKFFKSGEVWVTQVMMHNQIQTIPFFYHPSELEDIYVEEDVVAWVFRPQVEIILIVLDPDGGAIPGQAGVQISRLTGQRFGIYNIPTFSALTRMDDSIDLTNVSIIRIANCSTVNTTTSVIYIKIGERNVIYSEEGCVILEAESAEDTLKVAERFDYVMLGIM